MYVKWKIPEHVCKTKDRRSTKQAKCKYWNPKRRKCTLHNRYCDTRYKKDQTWRLRNSNRYHESCFALSISKLEIQNFYPNLIQYRFLLSEPNSIRVLSIHNPSPYKHRSFLSSSFFVLCTRFMFYNSNKLSMIYIIRDMLFWLHLPQHIIIHRLVLLSACALNTNDMIF